MASSSPINSCIQCHQSSSQPLINGWKSSISGYAKLCCSCYSLYEAGQFCEAFHGDENGWMDCNSCGKLVHYGCIVSLSDYTLDDSGGITCVECTNTMERVKGGSRSKDNQPFTSRAQPMENLINKDLRGIGSAVCISVDEETTQLYGSKSTDRGKQGSLQQFMSRRSERSASVAASASLQSLSADNLDSDSDDEPVPYEIIELHDSLDENESMQQGKDWKRGATRGSGRGYIAAKRGVKSDNTSYSIQQTMMSKDDDDGGDDDLPKRTNKSPPRSGIGAEAEDMKRTVQPKNKQTIKLVSNFKKISDLNLGEKVDLMKGSVFGSLSSVSNKRESSGTLIEALCKYYDASRKCFEFNNGTYFVFCSKEVADILGMEDSGIDYKDYEKQCSKFSAGFPLYLYKLRAKFAKGGDTKGYISASDLKAVLRNMTVDDAKSKQRFKELMSYYLIEQVLLCSTRSKPRNTMWPLINNLDTCETVNWAKATLDHLHFSMSDTKTRLEGGLCVQYNFQGAAPVLETIIYERIPSMRPSKWSKDSPPVQKYTSQRKDANKWIETKLSQLTPADIVMCPHCAA